jgi:hypothetical protein
VPRDAGRTVEANMAPRDQRQFWVRFDQAAKREGYSRPRVRRYARGHSTGKEAIDKCAPTVCASGVIVWFLVRLRRKRGPRDGGDAQATG